MACQTTGGGHHRALQPGRAVASGAVSSVTPAPVNQDVYYIAPAGRDAWSGTLPAPNTVADDGPFATPARVRDAIRQWKQEQRLPSGGAAVVIRGGTYIIGHSSLSQ